MTANNSESTSTCMICGCPIHRKGEYAEPTILGRSHATRHHFVAERFFGRSANRPGTERPGIFQQSPWEGLEKETGLFCYECHEVLLHNPVLLPDDIEGFAELVRRRNLNESEKTESREKLAGRIELLHEVLQKGIEKLLKTS
jgi:hypothetical protein